MAKTVTATIGGAERTLEFDWRALRRMGVERPLDPDQVRGAFGMFEGTMDQIVDAIHAGLGKHHPDVTRDELAAAMDYEAYGSVMAALGGLAAAEAAPGDPLPPGDSSGSTPGSGSGSG